MHVGANAHAARNLRSRHGGEGARPGPGNLPATARQRVSTMVARMITGRNLRTAIGLAAFGLAAATAPAAHAANITFDGGALVFTPLVLFVLFVFIAWGRRASIGQLYRR